MEVKDIIILESSDEDYQVTQYILKDYKLTRANNHDDLWLKTKIIPFDAIIVDLDMSNQDDLCFLNLIKALYYNIPVIIYTTRFSMDYLRIAMKNKANNYILKSGEHQELIAAISNSELLEIYSNLFRLSPDKDSAEIEEIKKSAAELGTQSAIKYFENNKNSAITDFSKEEIYTIFTGAMNSHQLPIKKDEQAISKDSPRNKILIVDDEELLRELLTISIGKQFKEEKIDVEFLQASCAQTAMDIYSKHKDEIMSCVIDMRMPTTNNNHHNQELVQSAGLEVLRFIKNIDPRCECTILTAYSYTNELCECYRLNAFELCDKNDRSYYLNTAVSAYKKALDNYNDFSDLSYTKLLLFRSTFGHFFVNKYLELFNDHHNLSSKEAISIIKFEHSLNKWF
jgi:DNA-binding NarL/FixJ family response regulator